MFLQVRDNAFRRFAGIVRDIAPGLDDESVRLITTYALAGADGLFIAKEVGGDSVDLIELFDLHARLVFDAAVKLLQTGNVVTAHRLGWQRPPAALRRPEQRHPDSTADPDDTRTSMWPRRIRCSGSTSPAASTRVACCAVTRSG